MYNSKSLVEPVVQVMLRMTMMRYLLKVKQKMMMMMMRIMVMKMKGITMQMMLNKALMMPVSNWLFFGNEMDGLHFIAYFNGIQGVQSEVVISMLRCYLSSKKSHSTPSA